MSSKELLYIEDTLSHEKFLTAQCAQAAEALTDPELKGFVRRLAQKHQQLFSQFYNLV